MKIGPWGNFRVWKRVPSKFRTLRTKLFESSRKPTFGFHVPGIALAGCNTHRRLVQIANRKRHWSPNELDNFLELFFEFCNFWFFIFNFVIFFINLTVTLGPKFLAFLFFQNEFRTVIWRTCKKLGGCFLRSHFCAAKRGSSWYFGHLRVQETSYLANRWSYRIGRGDIRKLPQGASEAP